MRPRNSSEKAIGPGPPGLREGGRPSRLGRQGKLTVQGAHPEKAARWYPRLWRFTSARVEKATSVARRQAVPAELSAATIHPRR
jgi:hypothetical protein